MDYLKKFSLLFTVFLTGASVLAIEIVATRILSPYYGNTIFTVSSVISVVLAALSFGYYLGGKLADRYPEEKIFYSIIFLSGFSVILLHFLMLFLLPTIGYKFSIITGPLIFSTILFLLPSFLLGTLSPFAIKLQEKKFPKKGIGSIAGEIFFWSTLGSIFGSLSAGFVLIPYFGINKIVLTVATILIFLGLFPLIKIETQKKTLKIIFLATIGFVLIYILSQIKISSSLYEKDGLYEKIKIYNRDYKGKKARFFQQDHSNSGGMFLDSEELTFEYSKYYALYKIFCPEIKNALVIGGGAYSVPKALLEDSPEVIVDVSEIEPSLFELAQKYFNLENSKRLHNSTDDGRRFLYDSQKKYDLIFSDVYYSLFSIPAHFTTQEFFALAKEKLTSEGIFVANLIGNLSRQKNSLILSEMKTFRSVFPNSYFFATESLVKNKSQNIIFVGYKSDKKIDFSDPKIKNNENPLFQSLENKKIDLNRFELSSYPILTDNFSPVEHLTSQIIKKKSNQQEEIDGDEMIALIDQQLRYGPRYLSAKGHTNVQNFILSELNALTKKTNVQSWQHKNYKLKNIVGKLYPEKENRIILATHYDSKRFADKDTHNPKSPVPGANDSASGVAVLLELARIFSNSNSEPNIGIDFVFFDGEEGEENQGGDYSAWKPLGSTYFAENLDEIYGNKKPTEAIVLDMVCDKNLQIFKEKASIENAPTQTNQFWEIAQKINPDVFSDKISPEIRDDHTPLNQVGIPSFLLIDFDYPPFHTTQDTLNKCSPESLETVAKAVSDYIYTIKN